MEYFDDFLKKLNNPKGVFSRKSLPFRTCPKGPEQNNFSYSPATMTYPKHRAVTGTPFHRKTGTYRIFTMTPHASEDQNRPLAGKRVLLAEDSFVRWLLADFLDTMGVRTRMASSGRDAVDLALQESFDLILMDVMMPDMNGIDATLEIRKHEQGPRTPIIALTSLAHPESLARCGQAGMDGFLPKPVELQTLQSVLMHHLLGDGSNVAAFPGQDAGQADEGMGGIARKMTEGSSAPAGNRPGLDLTEVLDGHWDQLESWKAMALRFLDEDLTPSLKRAADLAVAGKHDALSRVLHQTKGVAMFFGMAGIISICDDLKLAAQNDNETAMHNVLRAIPGILDCLRQAIADVENVSHGR